MNILFVCTGNTCRSPMAAAILQDLTNHSVQSAGIFAANGMPASEGTKQVLQQQGIHLDHQSQLVSQELLKWADIVLTMTQSHRDRLKQQFQFATEKIYTLKEYTNPNYESSWQQLKELYAEVEEKKLSSQQIDQTMLNNVSELEQEVQSVDIVDPFGGNIMAYQKTYEELKNQLAKLVKKLDNRNR